MSSIIDSIFTEWRASLPKGSEYPKFKNAYHMVLLKEICKKHGIDNAVIDKLKLKQFNRNQSQLQYIYVAI